MKPLCNLDMATVTVVLNVWQSGQKGNNEKAAAGHGRNRLVATQHHLQSEAQRQGGLRPALKSLSSRHKQAIRPTDVAQRDVNTSLNRAIRYP